MPLGAHGAFTFEIADARNGWEADISISRLIAVFTLQLLVVSAELVGKEAHRLIRPPGSTGFENVEAEEALPISRPCENHIFL